MFRASVLLFTLLALPLRANLGEDVKQLVTRYGTPSAYTEATPQFPFGTVTFTASGISLVVFLLGDKEVGAKVFKTDKSAFSEAERQSIMAADQGGSQWKSVPSSDPTCLEWTRSDKATVMYDTQKFLLIFTSDAMAKAVQAAQAAGPPPAVPAPAAPKANSTPVAPAAK